VRAQEVDTGTQLGYSTWRFFHQSRWVDIHPTAGHFTYNQPYAWPERHCIRISQRYLQDIYPREPIMTKTDLQSELYASEVH